MAVLPLELFNIICQYLDARADLRNIRLVCRYFAQVAKTALFRILDAGYASTIVKRIELQLANASICEYVTTLTFNARQPRLLPIVDEYSTSRFEIWYQDSVDRAVRRRVSQHRLEPKPTEQTRSWFDALEVQVRNIYPPDATAVRNAFQIWSSERDKHFNTDWSLNVEKGLDRLFTLASINTLVVADRGYHHCLGLTDDPRRMFDPSNPALRHDLEAEEDEATLNATIALLQLVIDHQVQLRHLALLELSSSSLANGLLLKQLRHVLPHLDTFRLMMDTTDAAALGDMVFNDGLRNLLGILGPKLTTLKLAFRFDDDSGRCEAPAPDGFLRDLHFPNLRVLHLKTCEFEKPEAIISLLDRHRDTLTEAIFVDQAFWHRGSPWPETWKPALGWLRDAAMPLERFVLKGRVNEDSENFLVVRGTFTKLSDQFLFEFWNPGDRTILIEDDGQKIIYGPRYVAEDRPEPMPGPWLYGGDVFDVRFWEEVDLDAETPTTSWYRLIPESYVELRGDRGLYRTLTAREIRVQASPLDEGTVNYKSLASRRISGYERGLS